MAKRKVKPVGDQYIDAHAKFKKKHQKEPDTLAEVDDLLNKLQIWCLTVWLNTLNQPA